jgi:hypothetical protein
MDSDAELFQENILKSAQLVLSGVFSLAGGDGSPPVIECLRANLSCTLFRPLYEAEIKNIYDYVYDDSGFLVSTGGTDDTLTAVADWDFNIDTPGTVNIHYDYEIILFRFLC